MNHWTDFFVEYKNKQIKVVIIPKGTILYRATPNVETRKMFCNETGKNGMYFSTYMLMALAMCIEYEKSMKLGIYEVTENINCIYGKYSHLVYIPSEYRDTKIWKNLDNKIKKELTQNINVNHFDREIWPILDEEYFYKPIETLGLRFQDGEVFISKDKDLEKIKLKSSYVIPLEGLLDVIKENNYSPYCEAYLNQLKEI